MSEAPSTTESPDTPGAATDEVEDGITLDSRIELHEYVVRREEGRDPLIGCPRVRRFIEVEEDTVLAIEAIEKAETLEEGEAHLLEKTGEEYDLVDLAEHLNERGFVKSVDGIEVENKAAVAEERHNLLYKVPPSMYMWVKHPAVSFVAGLSFVILVALMITEPVARPGYGDLFWTERPSLMLLSALTFSLLITYTHELGHFFMARAYGIHPTISISHRFYMLVLITDVTNAWILPVRQRIKIFLAGVGWNVFLLSLCTMLVTGMHYGLIPLPASWEVALRFIAFLNIFPIMFQFFLFARTDFYYVMIALLGERNLNRDSISYVGYRVTRMWRRIRNFPNWPCGACSAKVLKDDPFCLKCGEPQPIDDPNRYTFEFASKRRLLGFGIFMILMQVVMYSKFFTVGLRMQLRFFLMNITFLAEAFASGQFLRILEAEFLLLLSTLKSLFIMYFLGNGIFMRIKGFFVWIVNRVREEKVTQQEVTG